MGPEFGVPCNVLGSCCLGWGELTKAGAGGLLLVYDRFLWQMFPLSANWLKLQFSLKLNWSVWLKCLDLCNPMDYSTPGLPFHHQLPELTQTHVHWVGDSIQPSHPLSSPSFPTFSLSQHEGLFQWGSSSHQVAKVLELQQESFQWIFRTDFL